METKTPTDSQLKTGEITTPDAPRKLGRTRVLTKEEKRVITEKIAQWWLTPEPFREVATLRDLAKELGISLSYASRIRAKLPNTIDEWMEQGDQAALASHKEIAVKIAEMAKAGNLDAAKLYAQYFATPRRGKTQGSPKDKGEDKAMQLVERAMSLLPERKPKALPVVIDAEKPAVS